MGRALYLMAGFATAPGAAGATPTLITGVTTQLPNCPFEKRIDWIATWVDSQANGFLTVKSPRLHDAQNGVQFIHTLSQVSPLWPMGAKQKMYPQDTLTLLLAGSATAGDIESFAMLFHFEDLPGVSQRFIDKAGIKQHGVNIATIRSTLALGTAGGLSGEEAINVDQAHLKANTDYAVLGATMDNECLCINFRGPDTGNMRIPIPGDDVNKRLTSRWFVELTEAYEMPLIPVINSANAGATFFDGIQDENGVDPAFSLQLVELAPAATSAIGR